MSRQDQGKAKVEIMGKIEEEKGDQRKGKGEIRGKKKGRSEGRVKER